MENVVHYDGNRCWTGLGSYGLDKEGVKKGINIICDTTGAKCFVVVFIFGLRNPMLAGWKLLFYG
jgi:hypothetical protein